MHITASTLYLFHFCIFSVDWFEEFLRNFEKCQVNGDVVFITVSTHNSLLTSFYVPCRSALKSSCLTLRSAE